MEVQQKVRVGQLGISPTSSCSFWLQFGQRMTKAFTLTCDNGPDAVTSLHIVLNQPCVMLTLSAPVDAQHLERSCHHTDHVTHTDVTSIDASGRRKGVRTPHTTGRSCAMTAEEERDRIYDQLLEVVNSVLTGGGMGLVMGPWRYRLCSKVSRRVVVWEDVHEV